MYCALFTLLTVVVGEGALAWLIWRRMAEYLKGNPEAIAALTTHLFVPLLGKKEPPAQGKPEPKKIKGATLV